MESQAYDIGKTGDLSSLRQFFSSYFLYGESRVRMNEALLGASDYGKLEAVKYMIGIGASVKEFDNIVIRLACRNGHVQVVEFLTCLGSHIPAEAVYGYRKRARPSCKTPC